jgi:hypothetical protein
MFSNSLETILRFDPLAVSTALPTKSMLVPYSQRVPGSLMYAERPAPDLKVVGMPEQIRRGQAISNGFCSGCHSKTGMLTRGLDIGDDFPVPIGLFVSSNLTPAGQLM